MSPTATATAADGKDPSVFSSFRHIKDQAGDYFRARVELALTEGKEAGSTAMWTVVWAVVGAVVGLFGYALLISFIVALIASLAGGGMAWAWTLGVAALLHLGGAVAFLLTAKKKWDAGFFSLTREQFAQEKEWLKRTRPSSASV